MTSNQKIVVNDCVEIWIGDGIVHVLYLDGAEITPAIKEEMHHAFLALTGEKKHPFIFASAGSLWYTREGREYARAIESKQPFLAVAMVAPNLGFRLLAEFYAKFYKPAVPYKVFKSEEAAVEWLQEF